MEDGYLNIKVNFDHVLNTMQIMSNKHTELLPINISSQCRLKTSYVLSFSDTIIAIKILLYIIINVRYMKFKTLSLAVFLTSRHRICDAVSKKANMVSSKRI